MPASTLGRHLPLLEALFLIWFLPARSSNLGKRLVKSPKIHVCGSGLDCHLRGANAERWAIVLSGAWWLPARKSCPWATGFLRRRWG